MFQSALKTEGSLSNARAMAQLRQFYMRVMDLADSRNTIKHWENSRNRYIDQIMNYAQNKEGSTDPRLADIDNVEDAIKAMTKNHSDLNFLGWPLEIQSYVKVYHESRARRGTTNREKVLNAKYRHLMIEDKIKSLPFNESS